MSKRLIAERYASGLSAAIADPDRLEGCMAALNEIARLFQTQHDVHETLANPAIRVQHREAVLNDLLDAESAPGEVRRLIHLLLENQRIGLLPVVAAAFEDRAYARLNRVRAEVHVARPLSGGNKASLLAGLESFSGKTVQMVLHEDASLIDGFRAHLGGRVVDCSLRARLDRLKTLLIEQEIPENETAGD